MKYDNKRSVLVFFCLFFIVLCRAETEQSMVNMTRLMMTDAQIAEISQSHAKKYGLSNDEFIHYITLMQGYLGYWNPSIDPILALGMFAETEADRTRYAELYAKKEVEMTERVLQFQRTYREAFARLYPNATMTDKRLLAPYIKHRNAHRELLLNQHQGSAQIVEGDKLRWFVDDTCNNCNELIKILFQKIAPINNVRIDIFVVSVNDDNEVRDWAKKVGVEPQWVLSQRVTLNRDDGTLDRLSKSAGTPRPKLPALFLQRDNQFFQLRSVVNL